MNPIAPLLELDLEYWPAISGAHARAKLYTGGRYVLWLVIIINSLTQYSPGLRLMHAHPCS